MRNEQTGSASDLLDPAGWDAEAVRGALWPDGPERDSRPASGTGEGGMVVGSSGPFATLAGEHALRAGGSAVDAALVTAFAQVGWSLGSWVSYAGLLSLVHYEAATGEVSTLSAGFGTCADETDPHSIPSPPTPSGRTALLPGFVAGAHAAHERFGRLPWGRLWSPARYLAEEGVPVSEGIGRFFGWRAETLRRTAQGRAVFAPQGRFPREGELFRQPVLAETLRALSEQGPEWMYQGPWAEHFVEQVRRDGGRVRLADLADYQPRWAAPLRAPFAGHDVLTLPAPDLGGIALGTALALIDNAGLGDPAQDAEALYWLIQIVEHTRCELDRPTTLDAEEIAAQWRRLRDAGAASRIGSSPGGNHSDYVVTADAEGNMAAVCHSINTAIWGTTGIVVDGIPVPDPAAFQQSLVAAVKPGEHLPLPVNPAIALRDGQPVLACSSIGAGLHPVTVTQLHRVLRLGMNVETANAQPLIHERNIVMGDSITAAISQSDNTAALAQAVDDQFDPALLDDVRARGQELAPHAVEDETLPRGFWAAITQHQSKNTRYHGARTPYGQGPVRGLR